jgi:NitT/TauT family transport system substrate-binding protein
VKAGDGFSTFLRKPDADAFASKSGGAVMDLEGALEASQKLMEVSAR